MGCFFMLVKVTYSTGSIQMQNFKFESLQIGFIISVLVFLG